jgi:hypothetical protein
VFRVALKRRGPTVKWFQVLKKGNVDRVIVDLVHVWRRVFVR